MEEKFLKDSYNCLSEIFVAKTNKEMALHIEYDIEPLVKIFFFKILKCSSVENLNVRLF